MTTDRSSATALIKHARTLVNPEFRPLLEAKQTRASSPPTAAPEVAGTARALTPASVGTAPLAGVVALVEVGAASSAAALRSALRALGASVCGAWRPAVTHVVWGAGGRAAVRRTALRLNALVVSPRWVWQCAAKTHRVPEDEHSATRPSDPPSPRRMRSLLRWAEKENVPLDSSSDERAAKNLRPRPRLRLAVSDRSEATARPRRRLYTPRPPSASRSSDSDDDAVTDPPPAAVPPPASGPRRVLAARPFIVCTAVAAAVREEARAAAAALGGTVEARVSARTTHLVCGSARTLAVLEGAARGCWAVDVHWLRDSLAAGHWLPSQHYALPPMCRAHVVARALRAAGAGKGGPLLDVFAGRRVRVSQRARHAAGVTRLLRLCGAALAADTDADAVLLVTDSTAEAEGAGAGGAVSSCWVFDSVSAGRTRSLPRYRLRGNRDEPPTN